MALFKRKPKNQNAIPEVEQYYDAERRDRTGLAWVLALVSIIVVALIFVGLFFGGRWLYRTIKNDDTAEPTVTTSDNTNTVDGGSTNSSSSDGDNSSTSDSGSSSTGSSSGSTGSSSSSSNTGSTSSTQTTTPSTTTSTATGSIPNTGPGQTVAIFAATATAAAAGHYVYSKRRLQNR